MSNLNAKTRANLEATRQGVWLMVTTTARTDLHGEALECFLMEHLTEQCHMRDATDAAIVATAAMALARLVEHERGEREIVA